jgi:hypothetical protein
MIAADTGVAKLKAALLASSDNEGSREALLRVIGLAFDDSQQYRRIRFMLSFILHVHILENFRQWR